MTLFRLKTTARLLLIISMLILSACGGGGSSTNSTAATSTTPASKTANSSSTSATQNTSSSSKSSSAANNNSSASLALASSIPAGGIATIKGDYSVDPAFWSGDNNGPVGSYTLVDVDHPHFNKAARITVTNPAGASWNGQLIFPIMRAIAKDDVIIIHTWFRKISTTDESGASFASLFFETGAPKEPLKNSQNLAK